MKLTLVFFCFLMITVFTVHAQLTFPVPGRPDNLSQAQVDQLLANGEINFDGLRFDNKRMEFINFDKGSFRGTTFYICTLNDGIARRKMAEPDKLDFEDANFIATKLKRVSFSNWKFLRTTFLADSITDAEFKNCMFTENKFYSLYLSKVKFNNGLRMAFENVQFYASAIEGCTIDSIKFNGGAFSSEVKFTSTNFNAVEFFNVNFMKVASLSPVKFTGACSFRNVKLKSAVMESLILGDAPAGMWISKLSFENTIWRNGMATASFNDSCTFTGQAAQLQNINFTTSFFNSAVFGVQNAVYKLPVKLCRFINCTFGPVTFFNCDLEGTTFPPVTVLQAAGVRFINCLNAPYNSTL